MEVVGQTNSANNQVLTLGSIDGFWFNSDTFQYPVSLPLTFKITNNQGKTVQYSYETITTDLVNTGTML